MKNVRRRWVLGAVGSGIATTAGCSSGVSFGQNSSRGLFDDDSVERVGETLYEYVPASFASVPEGIGCVAGAPEALFEADTDFASRREEFGIDTASVDAEVNVYSADDSDDFLNVLSGDIDPDGDPVAREYDGVEYDLYERSDAKVASYDEVVLVAETEGTITDAIDARRGDTYRLVETEPLFEAGLSAVDGGHYYHTSVGWHIPPIPSGITRIPTT